MDRRQLLKALGFGAITVASVPLLQACAPARAGQQARRGPEAGRGRQASGSSEAGRPRRASAQPPAHPKRGGVLEVVVQNDWTTMDAIYSTSGSGVAGMICGNWIGWEKDAQGKWGPVPEMIVSGI